MGKRLKVHGRVQGVGFRYSVLTEALRRHLNGYVRNLSDGTVDVVVHGPQRDVEMFIEWIRQGPGLAEVDSVDVWDDSGDCYGFEIR